MIRTPKIPPQVVFHGTSREHWAKPGGETLYVTTSFNVAKNYAEEWLQADENPMVIAIDFNSILATPSLHTEPNWENVEQCKNGAWLAGKPAEQLTWLDTLEMSGTFCIGGFKDQHKALAFAVDNPNTLSRAPFAVQLFDEHENPIVYQDENTRISINKPGSAQYAALWKKGEEGKWGKVGYLETRQVTKKIEGTIGSYLAVGIVNIEKAYRGFGYGKKLYQAILAQSAPDIEGIISHAPDRSNGAQVPRIYRSLGAATHGDYEVIRRVSTMKCESKAEASAKSAIKQIDQVMQKSMKALRPA